MQVTSTKTSDTEIKLTVTADKLDLEASLERAVNKLGAKVKVPGFRAGTAPTPVLMKALDQEGLMNEFLEIALGALYAKAAISEKLKPIGQPNVRVTVFVPYDQLTFEADVPVLGPIELADYKKLKAKKPASPKTTKAEVEEVIENLRGRMKETKQVDRAAKDGDQVTIDFKGTDMDGKDVSGASGTDYQLVLGSKTFIPGYEEELIGLKAGDDKVFTITFPKDYGAAHLQSAKVTFAVTVKEVEEVVLPKVDDEFASKIGPFKTVADLKSDIERQLNDEKSMNSDSEYQNALVGELVESSKFEAPQILVDEQVEGDLKSFRTSLLQRGLLASEYAKSLGLKDEEEYIEKEVKPAALRRVKAGIVLSELAVELKIAITDEEVEDYRSELLMRYAGDTGMQQQLHQPTSTDALRSQLMSRKTVEKLVELNS